MRVVEMIAVRRFRISWEWLTWWFFLIFTNWCVGVEPKSADEEADNMPGKLLIALLRMYVSSSVSPGSEQTYRGIGRNGKNCNFYG